MLKLTLPCSIHTDFGCFLKVLRDLCKKFEKSHEKTQEHNHVLAPIVGKDLGQKIIWGILIGVLQGLINMFTPSLVQCSDQP